MGRVSEFRNMSQERGLPGFHWTSPRHAVTYVRRSNDRLVVTFDNMKSREQEGPRLPWGAEFLEGRGVSHMGVMMNDRNDWFRHKRLWALFDRMRKLGFFERFEDVLFYGSSMGGYGACAYAAAAPGARVLAFVPQSTLRLKDVPWEGRYNRGRDRGDWDTRRYRDGKTGVGKARQVQLFYDPYDMHDARHAARMDAAQVEHFHCGFMGHRVPRLLLHMGLLQEVVREAVDDRLDHTGFYIRLRCRRDSAGYVRAVLERAIEKGHLRLAEAAMLSVLKRHPDWKMPRMKLLIARAKGDRS